jgi:hypothetical protein
MKHLAFLIIFFIHTTAWSQTNKEMTTIETVKEVFLKGSIDGDSMFMVLGMQDGFKDSKDVMKSAIDMKDLAYIGKDLKEVGQDLKEFDNIIKSPWKSIRKIPGAYKVDFERARSAYYNADGQVSGVLKYSGWAVWANVKGSYYLVVEAPVVMASQALNRTVDAGWDITKAGLRITWNAIKPAFGALLSATIITYSTVSSTIATTATLLAAGGVAVYKGGKWLLVSASNKFFKPVSVKIATNVDLNDQKELADKLNELLSNSSNIFGFEVITNAKIKDFSSDFEIKAKNLNLNAFVVKTEIENKKVNLKLEVTRAYIKFYQTENRITRKEAKEKLTYEAQMILEKIAAHL